MATAFLQQYANGAALNISSMTNDAPNMRDLLVDDTTTGYTNAGTGAGGKAMCAYWDLGSSYPVDQVRCTLRMDGDISNQAQLTSSPDGTTWTGRSLVSNASTGASLASFNKSFTAVSARYWRLEVKGSVSDILTSMTAQITDYRIYVGGSQWILGGTFALKGVGA